MKKLILSIIFAGSALIGAQAAYNQDNDWYVQANGAYGWHNDSKYSFINDKGEKAKGKEKQKSGFGGSLAVGHIFDCWRLELEGSHRTSSSKNKYYTSNTSLMVNGYYDIPVTEDFSFYLGAGLGISSVNGKKLSKDTTPAGQTISQTIQSMTIAGKVTQLAQSGSSRHLDTVGAGQLMAGVSYAIDENWDLVAGYRLFVTTRPTLAKIDGQKIKLSKMPISNNVEIGLRFKF